MQLPASSAPSPGLHIIRPDTEQPHPSSSHTPELTARPAQGFRHLAPMEPPGTGILPTVGGRVGAGHSVGAMQAKGGAAGGRQTLEEHSLLAWGQRSAKAGGEVLLHHRGKTAGPPALPARSPTGTLGASVGEVCLHTH